MDELPVKATVTRLVLPNVPSEPVADTPIFALVIFLSVSAMDWTCPEAKLPDIGVVITAAPVLPVAWTPKFALAISLSVVGFCTCADAGTPVMAGPWITSFTKPCAWLPVTVEFVLLATGLPTRDEATTPNAALVMTLSVVTESTWPVAVSPVIGKENENGNVCTFASLQSYPTLLPNPDFSFFS